MDRVPPSAIDSERALLGAALQSAPAATACLEALRDHDLYEQRHQRILAAIRRVASEGGRPDVATVGQSLLASQRLAEVGGAAYLAELVDLHCPVPSNFRAYIRPVLETAVRRRVLEACTRALVAVSDQEQGLPEATAALVEDVEIAVGAREEEGPSIAPVRIDAALRAWLAEWGDGPADLLQTGYAQLDALLAGGLEAGEFVILGGRAGTGKTALALEMAVRVAEAGRGVLILSREMRLRKLLNRMLAQTGRIRAAALRQGRLTGDEHGRMHRAYSRLSPLPIWLDDRAESLAQVERMVDGWAYTPALRLVIVDYLQLLRADRAIKERRHQVEAISRGLKLLGMRRGCPVVALSALSRVEKGNQDRRPVISDLRESGELDHDADVVILLHRLFAASETEVILAKGRDCAVGSVALTFRAEYVAFEGTEP